MLRPVWLTLALLLPLPALAQIEWLSIDSPTPEADGRFGSALAEFGDADGDGTPDLLVGAYLEKGGSGLSQSGQAHIVSGADGTPIQTLTPPIREAGARFGASVAFAQDVNADGVWDAIVGEPLYDFGGVNSGVAHVFLRSVGSSTLISPNFQSNGWFGDAVAGLGDINGDGLADVAVGAPREDVAGGIDGAGRVYVFSGDGLSPLYTLESPTPSPVGYFGDSLTPLPDMDGDGVPDLLIGASQEAGPYVGVAPGQVHLFSGATGTLIRTIPSPGGVDRYGFGEQAAATPDIDGDGVADLLVSATQSVIITSGPGAVFLLSGATGAVLHVWQAPTGEVGAEFGQSVAAMGDLDGGGVADVAIGSSELSEGSDEGRVYVYSGETGDLLLTMGGSDRRRLGASMASVADRNGDGERDLAVGAPRANAGSSGEVVVFAPVPVEQTLDGPEGWRLLGLPTTGPSLGDVLGPIWTQGVGGADVSSGDASVFLYDETAGAFAPAFDLDALVRPGTAVAVYVTEDDDLLVPGVQGGFPKTLSVDGIDFAGAPFDFGVGFSPGRPQAESGWNALANPYGVAMDWDDDEWVREGVDRVIYVYDPAAGTFLTWNGATGTLGDGLLAPYQGFWTKAYLPAPSLVAPPEARKRFSTPPFYGLASGATAEASDERGEGASGEAKAAPAVLALTATATLGGVERQSSVHLHFDDAARVGHDPLDAYALAPYSDTALSLMSLDGADRLAIDARPVPEGPAQIGLDLSATVPGGASGVEVTLTWPDLSALPAEWPLRLIDTATGAEVDLRRAASYTFAAAASAASPEASGALAAGPPRPAPATVAAAAGGRFVLALGAGSVSTETAPEAALDLDVAPNPTAGRARIAWTLAEVGEARVSVLDGLGREVAVLAEGPHAPGRHEATWSPAGLASGVYAVRVATPSGQAVRRLTVVR